ncbi:MULTISPECIES: site-specific integrase [Prochlorococcus]|uniref:site-specific integrase n=1 Tax=Prochlorococcus TaxID=1218 RepID=UPI0005338FD3|nr:MULTISPECIES: site-specific integrase [Prochlorococcus]KGG12866.1 XisA-like site specific recombinase from phage integrase family [Prochlorococcus sp. MIT 0601]
MTLNSELRNINLNLASEGVKLRIEKRGQKLSIRGPLPCNKSHENFKVQRISLGIPASSEGLIQALKKLQLVSLQIEHKQFTWENWSVKKQEKTKSNYQTEIEGAIAKFESHFFEKKHIRTMASSQISNWNSAYKPYLKRLKEIAFDNGSQLNKEIMLRALSSYSENTRSRQQCGTVINSLANYLNIQLPQDWRKIAYGYGLHKAQFRKLPSDEQIISSYKSIPNQKWKLVFGLIATYGLRNHEVFFCDISCLKKSGDKVLRIFPSTKTGEHQAWPFLPEWVGIFNLDKLGDSLIELPEIQKDLSKTTLQKVGRRVTEQFNRYKIPFTPYDLRHAWAIRTIHIGLPDTVSARMMGHSVAIHTRTYHHWITRRDQQKAVDAALGKQKVA